MELDVALAPTLSRGWTGTVCVVVDELRASSTITTLLDMGCSSLLLTAGLGEARRLAVRNGSLLVGERQGLKPRGFDFNTSPVELLRVGIGGRSIVMCTSNGTRVLASLQMQPVVLIGCLLNARACARSAVELAESLSTRVGVVCAGQQDRFALEDAAAAGAIVAEAVEALKERGADVSLTDAARASLKLRTSYRNPATALRQSASGQIVKAIGAWADIEYCARADSSTTVPVLQPGPPLRITALPDVYAARREAAAAPVRSAMLV
jgi:2-phosphosulfolactate phosphatase